MEINQLKLREQIRVFLYAGAAAPFVVPLRVLIETHDFIDSIVVALIVMPIGAVSMLSAFLFSKLFRKEGLREMLSFALGMEMFALLSFIFIPSRFHSYVWPIQDGFNIGNAVGMFMGGIAGGAALVAMRQWKRRKEEVQSG